MEHVRWADVFVGIVACCIGLGFVVTPVSASRVLARLNKGTPGENMPYNRPDRVAKSTWMRLNLRVVGAVIVLFGAVTLTRSMGR